MLEAVESFAPDVVIVFRPEIVPAGLFAGLRVPDARLPHRAAAARDAASPIRTSRCASRETRLIDRSNFDRIVSFDPLFVEAADPLAPVWRSVPLPVDDRFFGAGPPVRRAAAGSCSSGARPSTASATSWTVKHRFDVLHMAHGVFGDRLLELLRETDVGINLHNEPYPSFENRVCLHLAAGNLVISEPLSPTHGLEPGIDYVEVRLPGGLLRTVEVRSHHRYPGPVPPRPHPRPAEGGGVSRLACLPEAGPRPAPGPGRVRYGAVVRLARSPERSDA